MASLESTAVTLKKQDRMVVQGDQLKIKHCSIALTGQGDTTDKILASAFGLTEIWFCSALHDVSNGKVYSAAPVVDRTYIVLGDGAANVYSTVTAAICSITVIGR